MSKLKSTILLVMIGVLIGVFLTGLTLRGISENTCEEECEEMNALGYEVIYSGEWFKLDDVCVCVFKDKIKAFELGDDK